MDDPSLASGVLGDGSTWIRSGQGPDLVLSLGLVPESGQLRGAAVAIETAARRADTVQQLVVADGACRLSEFGRAAQSRLADDLERGRQRRGWIRFLQTTDGFAPGTATGLLGSILPGTLVARDTRDVVATLRAEGAWDAEARLGSITARTLLVGGQDDRLYGPEPMRVTASGIPECSAHILPAKGRGVATTRTGSRIIRDFL